MKSLSKLYNDSSSLYFSSGTQLQLEIDIWQQKLKDHIPADTHADLHQRVRQNLRHCLMCGSLLLVSYAYPLYIAPGSMYV